jgi:hypothetical protein
MSTLTRDASIALYRIMACAADDGLPATFVRDNLLDYIGARSLDTATERQIAELLSLLRRRRHCEPASEFALHMLAVYHDTLTEGVRDGQRVSYVTAQSVGA